jgi:FkbM family methyltransferase
MQSFSQLGEDIFLFQNFINVPRSDLAAFEIGAYDGLTYSNTAALETFHKCRCVLVEPSPVNVKKIHRNRPKASIHHVAVALDFGLCEFVGHYPTSGLSDCLTTEYIDQWKLGDVERFQVLTAPMKAITTMERAAYIDFISIDVQGAELNVLKSMDWDVPIGTICIELEGAHPSLEQSCRELLRAKGFAFSRRLHISEFWFQPSYFRATLLFEESRKTPFAGFEFLHFDETWRKALANNFY